MKKLPGQWAPFFRAKPETGMGFHTGNVQLIDGRHFQDVVFDSGYVTRVRGYGAVPFEAEEISSIEITGNCWNWHE